MEVKLENLIEKIKKEGVQEAKKESEEIIKKANEERAGIIEGARKEADKILGKAKEEAERFKKNADSAVKQAVRDVILLVREQLEGLCDSVLRKRVGETLDPEFIKDLVVRIVNTWSPGVASLEVVVNEKDKKRLEEILCSEVKKETKDCLLIKVNNDIEKGFRIGVKGENVYYDFTDQSILESLKVLLNPEIAKLVDIDNG